MYYQWFKKIGLEIKYVYGSVKLNSINLLNVYPNPFTNTAILSIPNLKGHSYTLFIKDLSGKTVRIDENITGEKNEITREDLPAGLYLLELRGPNIYRGKIIIQ